MNKLGFGFLRLPMTQTDGGQIDLELLNRLTDTFLSHGNRYFDTAYTYLDGKSEWAIRESLVKRHPRNSFLLADKLPGYLMKSHQDCYRYFEEQLERCQVDFFDVYLLHWLNDRNYRIARQYQEFEFLQELKASGKAVKIGFSYHDTADLLDEILSQYPEVDYVQLQVNYLDWDSASIQAARCCRTAQKHGKQIIVMEPVKGGTLASIPTEAARLLEEACPGASPASMAVRFAQDIPNVEIVLSGMNTMEQLLDNLQAEAPLSSRERMALEQAARIISQSTAIPCTGCGYCLSACPKQICIPDYFRLYNEHSRAPQDGWKITPAYQRLTADHGRAADCIRCGSCERRCPQKLPVSEYLKKVSGVFDA